jgi:hypothetical protein
MRCLSVSLFHDLFPLLSQMELGLCGAYGSMTLLAFMRMSWRRMKSVLFDEDVLLFCFHEDVVEEDEKCFVVRRCSLFSICGNATRDGTHHFERGGDVTPG